ncbi:TPA: ABC transporter ATP-binding protein [Candidatus Poribacteria bacterium]|nr:ABC transporter ATP-binding protein [Candidatus Poribacteria bacterium]
MEAVKARGLTKVFGELVAVDHIDLDIPSGVVFGLLGPNGAGKTTTFRMIYGVLRPTEGKVWVYGHDVSKDAVNAKKMMGVLPEDTGIYPRLTAEENLIYFGKLHGMPEEELRRKIDEYLSMLELEEKRDFIAEKLSKGQRKKLAFIRAILHDPPILLLDEPTSGVDVISAREIRDMIKDYAGKGNTVILASHNMFEVEQLCDLVSIMHRGKIIHTGSIEEIKRLEGVKELEDVFMRLLTLSPLK